MYMAARPRFIGAPTDRCPALKAQLYALGVAKHHQSLRIVPSQKEPPLFLIFHFFLEYKFP